MRLLIVIAAFICACTSSTAERKKEKVTEDIKQNKVLLELFTSQGCSSCPPADALVRRLAQSDTNLLVISFHVDYWDRLGWKDVFSNHDYTLRQQQYVQALHIESAYTPQAVVQGEFEMVGSNQTGIVNAVRKAKEQAEPAGISAKASVDNSIVTVSYHFDETLPASCLVNVVLVQKQSSTSVARGENSGKQLAGYHVARIIKSNPLQKKEDSIQLPLPNDLERSNTAVIIFIQNSLSKKIVAVKQIDL